MKFRPITRILLAVLLILLIAALMYFAFISLMPDLIPMLKNGDEAEIEAYLRQNSGIGGMICTALLQMLAIFSVVFPSTPVQIAAGIVYGTLRSFIICHIFSVIAHTAVFYAARRFDKMVPPVEKKHSKFAFLLESDYPLYTTVLAYLIPVMPNGIVPYVAAKTKVTLPQFALAVFIGTFPPTIILCASGAKLISGDYLTSGILIGGLVLLVGLLWIFRKKIMAKIKEKKE